MERLDHILPDADETTVGFNEWARQCCQLARQHEEAGDYEVARRVMSPFWQQVGERPRLDDLDEIVRGEVLLRAGSLSGWIGSANRIEGGQEFAKDLISESLSLFERHRQSDKAAEARMALAICYWREGAFDESRVILRETVENLPVDAREVKAKALLLRAVVENSATRFHDSLNYLTEAGLLLESSDNHALKGRFNATLANNLQCLGTAEERTEYIDRALVGYAAASFHYEQAGHARYLATIENNIGFLFFTLEKYREAHEHLDRARILLVNLKDQLRTAQVDETRARIYLGQGLNREAARVIRNAVLTFQKSGEHALLAEALTTQATALARLNRSRQAGTVFQQAINIAEQSGSLEVAGLAALSLLEELDSSLRAEERRNIYQTADRLLARSQQPEIQARLRSAARRALATEEDRRTAGDVLTTPARLANDGEHDSKALVERLIEGALAQHHKQITFTAEAVAAMQHLFLRDSQELLRELIERTVAAAPSDAVIVAEAVETIALRRTSQASFAQPWSGFILKDETHFIEKRFIELALKEASGRISHAAKLLGFSHPEFLNSIIKSRHPDLLVARTPPIPRQKRSNIRKVNKH